MDKIKVLVADDQVLICEGIRIVLGAYQDIEVVATVGSGRAAVESVLSDPKTVIALDVTPHGNELVTDPSTGEHVRAEVLAWLRRYL